MWYYIYFGIFVAITFGLFRCTQLLAWLQKRNFAWTNDTNEMRQKLSLSLFFLLLIIFYPFIYLYYLYTKHKDKG